MLQLSLAPLLFLALFASLETAPSSSSGAKQEKYVRVYEINEEQFQRVLQLTKGKNVISEARLINGGFATVSDTLSSGWNSLLRIVGLTTLSKADETEKVDFDGQPLCVIKSREGEGREEDVPSARSLARDIEAEEEDSAIHCIVVLKKDVEFELPTLDPHPNYAQYWNKPETSNPVAETPVLTQSSEVLKEEEAVETETRIQAPLKKKKVNKSIYPRAGALGDDSDGSRQYGYPPLSPQYGTPYPPPPSYGGYPYSPYPNPPPYPNPQPYGPQLPYGPSPYGQSPYGLYSQQPYGPQPPIPPYSPQPYGPYGYPYLDQNQLAQVNAQKEVEKLEADDDEEEDEDSYETEDENDYRYKNRLYSYNPVYLQQSYNN